MAQHHGSDPQLGQAGWMRFGLAVASAVRLSAKRHNPSISRYRPKATGRGAGARRVAREGAASFVARRRRHPGVESAIHALESHGLDRVRTHGRAGFERTVGISTLAANLHRLGRLLQQRAARRHHRTHAPPYRLAA